MRDDSSETGLALPVELVRSRAVGDQSNIFVFPPVMTMPTPGRASFVGTPASVL